MFAVKQLTWRVYFCSQLITSISLLSHYNCITMKAKFNLCLSSDSTAVIPADNAGFALTAGVESLVFHLCRVTGPLEAQHNCFVQFSKMKHVVLRGARLYPGAVSSVCLNYQQLFINKGLDLS